MKAIVLVMSALWCAAMGQMKIPMDPGRYPWYGRKPSGSMLKIGKLIYPDVTPETSITFYYPIKQGSSFWLVIMPCRDTIEWKLTHIKENHHDPSFSNSSYASRNEDYRTLLTSGALDRSGSQVPVSIRHSRSEEMGMTPRMASGDEEERETVLVQEVGESRMNYDGQDLPAGILLLSLRSVSKTTSVGIFPSTEHVRLIEFFPKLPKYERRRVQLNHTTPTSTSIFWEHSPSINFEQERHIHYCIVLSTKRKYESYCERRRTNEYEEEAHKRNTINDDDLLEKHKVTGNFAADPDDKVVILWKKNKNAVTFTDLTPGTKYYLSLFAVNKYSAGSTTYTGLSFRTPIASGKKVVPLVDNEVLAAYLNPGRSTFQVYEFHVSRFQPLLHFIIQPCSGTVEVYFRKRGSILHVKNKEVGELRRFAFTRVTPGTFRIKVVNADNEEKIFKILASINVRRDPYPVLPKNPSLMVMDNSRSCNKLTLVWLPIENGGKYCLYKRREADDYFKRLILEESSQCKGAPSGSYLVGCQTHVKGKNESNAMFAKLMAVPDLQPNTMYRFDLFASPIRRNHTQHMSYRTIWVKTKAHCHHPTHRGQHPHF